MTDTDLDLNGDSDESIGRLLRTVVAEHLRDSDFASLADEGHLASLNPVSARARIHLRACGVCAEALIEWVVAFVMGRQPSPGLGASQALALGDLFRLLDHPEPSVRAAALRAVPLFEVWTDPILARIDAALQDVNEHVRAAASETLRHLPAAPQLPDVKAASFILSTATTAEPKAWPVDAPMERWAARRAASLKLLRELAIPSFLAKVAARLAEKIDGMTAGWALPTATAQKAVELAHYTDESKTWSLFLTEFGRERIVQIAGSAPELAGLKIDVALSGHHACTLELKAEGDIVRASGRIPPELRRIQPLGPDSLEITIGERRSFS